MVAGLIGDEVEASVPVVDPSRDDWDPGLGSVEVGLEDWLAEDEAGVAGDCWMGSDGC